MPIYSTHPPGAWISVTFSRFASIAPHGTREPIISWAVDGEAVSAVIEAKRLGQIDEGQDRATQGGVTVDVVFADPRSSRVSRMIGRLSMTPFIVRTNVCEYDSRAYLDPALFQ